MLAAIAAICQAAGAILAGPALESGISPIAATTVRVGTATLVLFSLSKLPISAFKQTEKLDGSLLLKTIFSALIGMCTGMTLLMLALSSGHIGIAMTYASLTPIMTLPILWMISKSPPSILSWTGALLATMGTSALILFK